MPNTTRPASRLSIKETEEEELGRRGYHLELHIGEGSYAKVKSASSERLHCKVAIKIIHKSLAPQDFREKFLPRELSVLTKVDHPHVIKVHEIMEMGPRVYIVMDYAGHGDLLEYIQLHGALPESKVRVMFRQLLTGVQYLHSQGIVHRDLKCENILLDSKNNIKISDFGFAREFRQGELSRTFCGSAAYAAPEVLQGIPYLAELYDVWSLGVILYIMACGSMPFDDSNIKKMIKVQLEKKYGFPRSKRVNQDCKELINEILTPSVTNRPTIEQVLQHHFFTQGGASSSSDQVASGNAAPQGATGGSHDAATQGGPAAGCSTPEGAVGGAPAQDAAVRPKTRSPREPRHDATLVPRDHHQPNATLMPVQAQDPQFRAPTPIPPTHDHPPIANQYRGHSRDDKHQKPQHPEKSKK
ncbi:PREDICTED: testis-specific serine/threonine-protein kinase 2-like [Branchiostoma belcheri]|uniref:non-specific serine/threonine protein kinase n=1 Tax=Branchiostoma belcheri TaxID=7741 RepID=A0A6P4ZQS3_BRABE|nr:PREDICTED: testis-specific serine/threonine-protein kinase 2-like [Branchiostoma belcheri]